MWKLDEGENIIKVLRRHYWVMLPFTIGLLILSIFPLLFFYFISSDLIPLDDILRQGFIDFINNWDLKVFAYSVYLILLWVFFFI